MFGAMAHHHHPAGSGDPPLHQPKLSDIATQHTYSGQVDLL